MPEPELNEEALAEELGIEALEPEDELDDDPKEVQLTAKEQEAVQMGWNPDKEAFIEKGGDSESYVSAHEYVRYGKQKAASDARLSAMERKQEAHIVNLNKLHKAQMDATVADLQAQQRRAVEDADTPAYDALQAKIDAAQVEPIQQAPAKDAAVIAWEAKNPWVNEANNPKALEAINAWNMYSALNPNATPEQALAHVDDKLEKLYPTERASNPRRETPAAHETGKTTRRASSKGLRMSDLTASERDDYNKFGDMFPDEKAFLKAAADARKG